MKIVPITAKNSEVFIPFLPIKMMQQKALAHVQVMVLACQLEEKICGTIMLEYDGEQTCVLLWLWVDEPHRNKGVANLLLDAACGKAFQQGVTQIEASYLTNTAHSAVFNYMLATRMAELTVEEAPCITVSREKLLASPLMENAENLHGKSIVPLHQVPPLLIKELVQKCQKKGISLVSGADYMGADGECSMALQGPDGIQGLVLLHKNEDVFRLSLFYLEEEYLVKGLALLRAAAYAALRPEKKLKTVEFTCLDENVLRLTQRLLGQPEVHKQYIGRGLLLAEPYNRRKHQ